MDLGRQLESSADEGALLAALAEGARGMLPFGACALGVKDGSGSWVVWRAPAGRPEMMTVLTAVPEAATSILDRFLHLDQPLVIADLLAPPWRDTNHREVLWKTGTRSALLLPLVAAGQTHGILAFTAFQPDAYEQTDLAFARFVAWLVALTLKCGMMNDE